MPYPGEEGGGRREGEGGDLSSSALTSSHWGHVSEALCELYTQLFPVTSPVVHLGLSELSLSDRM